MSAHRRTNTLFTTLRRIQLSAHRRTNTLLTMLRCVLILSLIFSPLAPQGRAAAAGLEGRSAAAPQSGQSAPAPGVVFTNAVQIPGGKTRAEAGDVLSYTLTLTNNGPDAGDVVVQDTLGPGLSLVDGSLEVTPLAYAQALATAEDTPLDITLAAADGDGDPLAYTVTVDPAHGALSGTAPNLTYTPGADYTGADSFTFKVNDGKTDSSPAVVSIQVDAVADAPVCTGASITTGEDTPAAAGPVCSDADLDALTYAIAGQPLHGAAAVEGGQLTYAPAHNFHGEDSFTYTASDGVNTSSAATVAVTVTPANDGPSAETQSLTTAEDTSKEITLTGADIDGDALAYTISDAPAHGSLSGSAPAVTYTPGKDYNGADSFTFQVCDTAAAPLCATAVIDLAVSAVNDAPTFTAGADQSVSEDSGAAYAAAWATAISPGPANESGQTLHFEVTGNTNPALFASGPSLAADGGLSFTPAVNANGAATITIRLRDNGGASGGGVDASAPATFVITVGAVNDAPTVQAAGFELDENSANATLAGTASFSDPDGGQAHTYAITSGNTGGAFSIDAAGGQIRVANAAALDFETTPTFSLAVRVTDDGSPALSGTNTITIDLNDRDETPSVSDETFSLDENAADSTTVGTVTFDNQDADQEHTFAITAGNTGGAFAIDAAGGEITVANPAALDFEAHPVFSLTVTVSDDSTPANVGSSTVTINLNDVNEAPAVDPAALSVDENSAAGAGLGTVTYSDPDSGQTHTFAITAGNTGGTFAIDAATGALSVADPALLNYETQPSFALTVQVTDSGSLAGEAAITINLNNVNEAPVVNTATLSVDENSSVGTGLGTVAFSDPESGQTHTFAITAGNTGGTYTINAATGALSVANRTLLDYEAHPSFTLTVQVTDGGGLAGEAAITVNLKDVNEAPVVSPAAMSIDENSAAGTSLGTVSYSDPDAGQSPTFAITGGSGAGKFTIHATSGVVRVATGATLDYETSASYSLTVQVTDNGVPALSGAGTLTISVNDVAEAPLVTGESYETIGNTLLEVDTASAQPAPRVFVSGNLLANDSDPDGDGSLTAGPATVTSAQGGTASIASDGSFTYLPPVGYTGGDSFDYTVTDAGSLSSEAAVTLLVKGMVWYVKNNAAAGGSGRSTQPFNTLAAAGSASAAGSTIYVYAGDGTTGGQNAGITLDNNQRLIGAGVALDVAEQVNGGGATTSLLPAGAQPHIGNDLAGGHGVTAANVSGVEIRGLNVAGAGSAIHVSAGGSSAGSAAIQENTIRAAGVAGIKIEVAGAAQMTAAVQNNSLTATGAGFDAQNTSSGSLTLQFSGNTITAGGPGVVIGSPGGGPTTITSFNNNTVSGSTGGDGVAITGAAFDATPGGAFQTVAVGGLAIGASGSGVGGSGLKLTNVTGDLSFTGLAIYADNGPGLLASSSGAYTGSGGFRLSAAAGDISATGGPALDASAVTLNVQLASLSSTNSPTKGVRLASVNGTLSAAAGSLTGGSSGAFEAGSSTAGITYGGTVASSAGRAISVTNHSSGAVVFSGSVTATGGEGIYLDNNDGSTISFSGGLALSTGDKPAFTAVNGGVVNVSGASNTLATTTGTALKVENTTIGSSGLTFRSISAGSAGGGPANGIVLNATGASGGLKVTGAGAAGSGGSVQHAAGDCIVLTSTQDVELNSLNLSGCGGMGINASTVSGFKFRNGQVQNAGKADGGHGMSFNALSGTALIQDTTITNSFEDGIQLINAAGALDLTVRRVTVTQNTAIYGEDGLQFRLSSNATANILVNESTFSNLQRDGMDGAVEDTAAANLTITSSQFKDGSSNGGVNLSSMDSATLRLNLTGNTFTNNPGSQVNLVSMDGSTLEGHVNSNTLTGPAGATSGGSSIRLRQKRDSTMTLEALGNILQNSYLSSFEGISEAGTTAGRLNLTLRGSTAYAPLQPAYGAVLAAQGVTGSTNQVCLDIGHAGTAGGNKINGSGGLQGIYLEQYGGSRFNIAGWNTGAHPSAAGHVQAYNVPTTTYSDGTFTAVAAGACPTPGAVTQPAAVASSSTDETMANNPPAGPAAPEVFAMRRPAHASRIPAPAAGADEVVVNVGDLPAGETVVITFDVQIVDPLPEDMLKVSNQARASSTSFTEAVLSDDPATPDAAGDATETLLYRAPIAHDDAYTTPEDTPIQISAPGALANDTTALDYEALLTAVKDGDPVGGEVDLAADGSFTFTPAQDFNGAAGFSYHSHDTQSGSQPAAVRITVTPVNDAPVLAATGLFSLPSIAPTAVDNPGAAVSAIIASAPGSDPIQDVDAGALEGLAITGVSNTHGRWQYSLDGGAAWQDFGSLATGMARLLASDGSTRIRFVPDQSWKGTLDPGIQFHAWDQSSGVNGEVVDMADSAYATAFSAAGATASITLQGIHDLALTIDSPAGPLLAGTTLEYSLRAANIGAITATGVVVTDTLPDGIAFDSASPGCVASGQAVTCSIERLEVGQSVELVMAATIGAEVYGSVSHTASVTSAETDENPANNQVQAEFAVTPGLPVYTLDDPPGDEWSDPITTTSPNGVPMLGEFGSQDVTLRLDNLPVHSQVNVSFDLYIIGSWDGNQALWPGTITGYPYPFANASVGPDLWRLDLDGANLVTTTFSNFPDLGFRQAYPGSYPGGSYPAQTGAAAINSLGYLFPDPHPIGMDATYRMSYTVAHQGPALELKFGASSLQSLEDESWGLGNVRITVSAGGEVYRFKLYSPVVHR